MREYQMFQKQFLKIIYYPLILILNSHVTPVFLTIWVLMPYTKPPVLQFPTRLLEVFIVVKTEDSYVKSAFFSY